MDPNSVIKNPNEPRTSAFNLNRYGSSSSIQAILNQFLNDGGRSLNDFTRGNLVGDSSIEFLNSHFFLTLLSQPGDNQYFTGFNDVAAQPVGMAYRSGTHIIAKCNLRQSVSPFNQVTDSLGVANYCNQATGRRISTHVLLHPVGDCPRDSLLVRGGR
jgi:hypothetical protein